MIDSAASLGLQESRHKTDQEQVKRRSNLLVFSANHPESLKRVAQNIQEYLKRYPERLDDLAYTLSQRREHLKLRSYCVAKNDSTSFEVSSQTKYQAPRQAAFVFTGQGAQW